MMATVFKTSSGSQYIVDGLKVKREGVEHSTFDGRWWPLKAAPLIRVGAVVWLDLADPHHDSHTFTTSVVDEIWSAGIA
jgi:hypothetical protein